MSTSPTTIKQKQGSLPFDEKLFEQAALSADEGAGYVAINLGKVIYSDKLEQILEYLLSKSSLFEYIYSIIDNSMASKIQEKLTDGLKTDSEPMSVSALAITVLERLAGFLYFRLADFTDPDNEFLLEYYKDICNSDDEMRVLKYSCGLYAPQPRDFKLSPRQSPSGKRRNSRRMTVTEDDFSSLSIGPSRQLLEKYRTRLEEMLKILRAERYSNKIRSIFEDDMTRQSPISIRGTIETNISLPSETDLISPIAETSKAYLSVQPLKASLYLANAKGLGQWRIFLSTRAISDLRSYSKSKETFRIIIKKIQELSNGDFSDNNQKRLQGNRDGVPIFRAKLTNDLRLIYQIDCISDFNGLESQVLRIFGVFTLKQMDDRMWSSLSTVLSNKGRGYNKRVNYRRNSGNNHFLLPQSWQIANETEYGDYAPHTPLTKEVGDFQSVHHWLVLEKYSVLSQEILNCIKSGKEAMPVFAVSPYERDIIDHPSSCYVLGRSGTGKTTTMLFKILGIERAASIIEQRPRQLFVTRSHVLTGRVKNYFMKMKATYDTNTGYSLQTGFTEGDDHLGDVDDEEDKDLPQRFSELTDGHFPLFLTFDTLCTLIEADLDIMSNHPAGPNRRSKKQYKSPISDGQNVTFEVFCKDYWPHIQLTRKFSPVSIFNEIIGVIKGSEPTLDTDKCYLSQQSYLALSERAQPMFSGQRDSVYEIFLKYQEKKRMYGDYDDADRTHTILRGMNNRDKELFQSIDYLFVDETQDNLAIDAFLLRQLCRNPHGLFWAGDTAQTILMGSSFRFADLKASLYRFERVLYPYISEKMIVDPKFFQLTTNYRSHDGIVSCADTITQMLSYFWPESIDVLRREEGLVAGTSPIFFEGWKDGTSQYSKFLFENSNSQIEIGAKQCVLVRDKQARDKLYNQIGKKSELIMTLYDSKGLEFDDVLLYNFFEDSPYDELHWKVVLNFLKDKYDSEIHAPHFDKVYHSGICTELKLFYVAITRARESVWIIDGSDKGGPMKDLLLGTKSVTTCRPEDAPPLKSTSSKEDWASSGTMYFNNHKYSQAAYCFNRAGMTYEYEVANAYHLRLEARKLPRDTERNKKSDAYSLAAEAFHKSASHIGSHKRLKLYYRISAECYQEAERFVDAAKGYEIAEEYAKSAYSFMKGGNYDKAKEILKTKSATLDSEDVEEITLKCRLHYLRRGKIEDATELFDSSESFFEFTEDYGFDIERAEALIIGGNFYKAAEILISEGKVKRAIEVFLQDKKTAKESRGRVAEYLLSELWKLHGFGVPLNSEVADKGLWKLHKRLMEDPSLLETDIENELRMFELIHCGDVSRLRSCYKQYLPSISAHTLVLDKIIQYEYNQNTGIDEAIEHVLICCTYAKALRQLFYEEAPSTNPHLQKLFGFREVKDGEYLIGGALLSEKMGSFENPTVLPRTEEGSIYHQSSVESVIKGTIEKCLGETIEKHKYLFSRSWCKSLEQPCIYRVLFGRCTNKDCQFEHVDTNSLKPDWFNKRARIHLLRMIYWGVAESLVVDPPREYNKIRASLLEDFFTFLHPILPVLGSMTNLQRDLIQELNEGMKVDMYWFLNTVMETLVLGLNQNPIRVQYLFQRSWLYGFPRGYTSIRINQVRFASQTLFNFLNAEIPSFVTEGCKFINLVLDCRLKLNLQYLCQFFQLLCGVAALTYRGKFSFHGCLLPKSWISRILPRIGLELSKWNYNDTRNILFQCEKMILHLLNWPSNGDFLYQAHSKIFRSVSIQILLSSICFLGYNSGPGFRGDIINMIKKMKSSLSYNVNESVFLPYFIESWSWPKLLPEVKKPFQSQLDGLVQLCYKNADSSHLYRDSSITSITYKNVDELYQLFPSYNLTSTVPTTSSQPVKTEEKAEEKVGNTEEEINASLEQEGEKGTEIVSDDLQPENDSEQKEMQVIRLVLCFLGDVEKDKAAFTLQKCYKTLYKRKKEVNSSAFQKLMNSYTRCTVSASNKTWSVQKRRFMYLGMVPHILVCIDVLLEKVVEEKKKWNKLLKEGNTNIDEGELMRRTNDTINTRKRLESIKSELSNKLDWFEFCKRVEMEERVRSVSELVNKFGLDKITDDINLALKVVRMGSRPTMKNTMRPKLNVEDPLYEFDYDDE